MSREPLKELSIRCSGLMTEAEHWKKMNKQEIADYVGLTDRTLREKSRADQMHTLPIGVIAKIAGLAGYSIEFVRKEAG